MPLSDFSQIASRTSPVPVSSSLDVLSPDMKKVQSLSLLLSPLLKLRFSVRLARNCVVLIYGHSNTALNPLRSGSGSGFIVKQRAIYDLVLEVRDKARAVLNPFPAKAFALLVQCSSRRRLRERLISPEAFMLIYNLAQNEDA